MKCCLDGNILTVGCIFTNTQPSDLFFYMVNTLPNNKLVCTNIESNTLPIDYAHSFSMNLHV
jgi:hypothetical protein